MSAPTGPGTEVIVGAGAAERRSGVGAGTGVAGPEAVAAELCKFGGQVEDLKRRQMEATNRLIEGQRAVSELLSELLGSNERVIALLERIAISSEAMATEMDALEDVIRERIAQNASL